MTETVQKQMSLWQKFLRELKRSALIGSKMLDAGHSNSALQRKYSKLGRRMFELHEGHDLIKNNKELSELIEHIHFLKQDLESLEKEVQGIKG